MKNVSKVAACVSAKVTEEDGLLSADTARLITARGLYTVGMFFSQSVPVAQLARLLGAICTQSAQRCEGLQFPSLWRPLACINSRYDEQLPHT